MLIRIWEDKSKNRSEGFSKEEMVHRVVSVGRPHSFVNTVDERKGKEVSFRIE